MSTTRSAQHLADPARHFRCGSLDAWRAAFFVSLGWSATACGGEVAPTLPERLQCSGDGPLPGQAELRLCSNGIVHRPEPAGGPCVGCVGSWSVRDECDSDADCADGALCVESREALSTRNDCGVITAEVGARFFACQTVADRCAVDLQCSNGLGLCALDDGARQCFISPSSYPCGIPGRPFLVGGEIRCAPARAGAGWCDPSVVSADGLDSSRRARAVQHYQQAALLEHASIAAFARFTLQLLELGAPASLCHAAQQAMRDETLHAQLCFTLASRYAGQPIAPGPLSMRGALAPTALEGVAQLCLLEGCVGETLAALEAAEALAGATDPEVRAALERITDDERRHAELAFRFLAWALEKSPAPGLRHALAAVLDATVEASRSARGDGGGTASAASAANDDPILERHGILSDQRQSALRRAALEEVVVPCVRQLLADAERSAQPPLSLARQPTS